MLLCCLALCALLSLANTLLYLYYRKEPEIKASSVGLSMLMHLSCYCSDISDCYSHSLVGVSYREQQYGDNGSLPFALPDHTCKCSGVHLLPQDNSSGSEEFVERVYTT